MLGIAAQSKDLEREYLFRARDPIYLNFGVLMYQVYCSRIIVYKDSLFKESHIIQRLQITWYMDTPKFGYREH